MAYATINKGSSYFNTLLYTGNGSTLTVTGNDFQPDFTWIKERSAAGSHKLADVIRGTTKYLSTNSDAVEDTTGSGIQSWNSTGFSLSNATDINDSGQTYAAWNWLANGAGVSNTSGTITSTVSANQTAGFSIVSYTGNGTSGATVGHGLGVAPNLIIVKNRTRIDAWPVDIRFESGILYLNETGSKGSYGAIEPFTSTAPTSTVFSLGSAGNTNFNGSSLIAYCFAPIKGFSKFGSYIGNGSTDGPFVYTGFKPAFLIAKRSSSTGNWRTRDNKRSTYNAVELVLNPNLSNAETTEDAHDFLSNGFKVRTSGPENNSSGGTFIYMAFAENPFVLTDGTPVTAR